MHSITSRSTPLPPLVHRDRRPVATHRLFIPHEGIRFHNTAHERVQIEITVENRGPAHSVPTQAQVEVAPFGAFVAWRPLVTLEVPSIEPGGATILRALARQPRPGAVGGFSGFLPRGLAPAAAGDGPRPIQGGLGMQLMIPWMLAMRTGASELPPELLELLDGPRPHWAGNLNVWIGRRPVERHLAPRLRVYPGRCNLALFLLGGEPDAYAFGLDGLGGDWRCALHECRTGACIPWTEDPIEPRWHATRGTTQIVFLIRPPEFIASGSARVHVIQRSSGKTALVEFDLDPKAEGPGCFQM